MLIGWLIGILGAVSAQSVPVLNPARAVDTSFSSLFNDVEIVPLETRRESVFGIVKQLLVTDQYFIILDPDTDAVLFFDKQGRFLTKYKNKQRRYRISFIQLDPAHNALLIFSQNKNYNITTTKLQSYLLQGATKEFTELVKSTRLYLNDIRSLYLEELKASAYLLTNPTLFGSGNFAYSFIKSNNINRDKLDYQLQIVNDNGVIKSFFPYNKKRDAAFNSPNAWQCRLSTTLNDSVLFVTRPFDSTIYSLTPATLTESYKVVLPQQDVADRSFGMESVSFFDGESFTMSSPNFGPGRSNGTISFNAPAIGHVFDLKQFLFFSIRQPFVLNYFIYNKTNGSIYNYKELIPDSSNYMFPSAGAILAFDENSIYQSLTARSLFRMKKNAVKSKWQYQEALNRFYKAAKETDNPVLIRIKPKNKPGL